MEFDILYFLAAAIVILIAGNYLSKYADEIAEFTGIGKVWIGLVLLAFITSLPELLIGLNSVIYLEAPDLAAGDIFGSCAFNLFIIVIIDFFSKGRSILSYAGSKLKSTAVVSLILLNIALLGIIQSKISDLSLFGVSITTPIIFLLYLVSMRFLFYSGDETEPTKEETMEYSKSRKRRVLIFFTLNAMFLIVASIVLSIYGERIASATGLGHSFFGTFFIAASTSLPEIVVSIASVRIGSYGSALGNLIGSNVFNIFILGLDDLFYKKGPLLKYVSFNHSITIIAVMVLTLIALLGMITKEQGKRYILSWNTFSIASMYLLTIFILFLLGANP